jgi:CRISPR-associated protein Cas5h
VLCFKLKGDLGHFKPYYTTSSPTTYSLIPPMAIFGVIGAILGFERKNDEYYFKLVKAGTRVGAGIINPVKKRVFGINLINTKDNYWVPTKKNPTGVRTPIRYEYVVKPEYLVFVTMSELSLLDSLAEMVKKHLSCYSVCLGLSELLADFEYVFYSDVETIVDSKSYLPICSAVPMALLKEKDAIALEPGVFYNKERYVKVFDNMRIPADYVDVVFPANGKKAKLKCSSVYKYCDYYFTFMN